MSYGHTAVPVLLEGYGRVMDIKYDNWQNDPQPNVLLLGTWTHPRTGNQLMTGINLNYLNKRQVDRLRYYLPEIIKSRNLYVRYHTGANLLPDIFKEFYRYYNTKFVNLKQKQTLKFMTPDELIQQGDLERGDKLAKRREQFRDLTKVKTKQARIMPQRRPVIVPPLPPEEDEELPPEVPTDALSTADKAKRAVDNNRASKLTTSIDRRVQGEVPPEEAPPEEVPEEVPSEPEVPEEVPPEPEVPEEEEEE